MKICPSCKSEYGGGEVFCPNDGARLYTASQLDVDAGQRTGDPLIGTVLAERYKILHQIGEGGMGLVYEAEHITIEKRVAIKVLRDDFSSRSEVVQRFRQEAKSASKIGNEHIVDISDFGTTPSGASYFVMELLSGEDLANVLARDTVIGLERAADVILQCCTALGAAHSKGIVHRDMKPENIFLTEREERADFVKLVDFGIAKMSDIETDGAPGRKLTKTGMIFGTPEYMSPEQAAGKELDHRVDVYALAVILFEMLTGRVPFLGDTFMGILTQHMFEDPPAPEEVNSSVVIPEAVIAFIYKGLAKEPDDRYQSCEEMAQALTLALQGVAAGPSTYSWGDETISRRARTARKTVSDAAPAGQKKGSKLGMIAIAAAVLLAAVVGAGVVWYLGSTQNIQAQNGTATQLPELGDAGDPAGGATSATAEALEEDAGPIPAVVEVDAGPPMVTVSVNTTPSGAAVFVEGRGEVCESTPCSFETLAGEEIVVRARRAGAAGEATIAPEENNTIQLEMRRSARRNRRTKANQGTGNTSTQRRGSGSDLKIPDIFAPH